MVSGRVPLSPVSTKNTDDSFYLGFNHPNFEGQIYWQLETTTGSSISDNILMADYDMADNVWHFLVTTYDGAEMRIYVDSVLVADLTANGTIVASPTHLEIGRTLDNGNPSAFFSGLIDEVEIYNRALTATEIKAIYDAGSARTYAGSIQNFDTAPHWTRFNNPANSNDFGFQDSNLAGGTAGEAGGFFSRTSVPVWYGDERIGAFGGNDALSASGILNLLSVDADYNTSVLIGHFDNEGFSVGNQNGIGLQVVENGMSSFRIFYLTGTTRIAQGLLFTIVGLDLTRTWSYNYDPSAGSFGSLTVSISGPGGGTATHFLTSGERDSIGSLETFGLSVVPTSSVNNAQAEIYIDNLSYTSSTEVESHG